MTDNANPYQSLPAANFWRSAVVDPGPFNIVLCENAKFLIGQEERVFTAGSCFAQRLSQHLVAHGINWVDAEPAPPMLSETSRRALGYGVFSARVGNIYTAAMLRQWVSWAFDGLPDDLEAWHSDIGRVQDPFRPEIEPGGFVSLAEMEASRCRTIAALRDALTQVEVFVFTMGLTETWINAQSGHVYPSCPGTVAGQFDADLHKLVNQRFPDVRRDLVWTLDRLRAVNPGLKVVLTVSPVPLTATAEPGGHALTANTYTKSLLRTVAGDIAHDLDYVDYFPGYEMVATPPFRGMFYAPNMRTVDHSGVEFVMSQFMQRYLPNRDGIAAKAARMHQPQQDDADLICHDYILDFYRGQP